ncbi:MAG: hypothetical protein KDD61_00975 [Bdellovibrionales bacterium]|nr:hypothetical protein [Bdellovibrionales bacterium]
MKYFLLVGSLLFAISSQARVQLTLQSESVEMWSQLETTYTERLGEVLNLKSNSVRFNSFRQSLELDTQGVSLNIQVPIDNNIGSRIMILLYNDRKSARLIYYHDTLGNMGADVEDFSIFPDPRTPGEYVYVFRKESLEKAFRQIYNKAMVDALSAHIDIEKERSLCAQMDIETDMRCSFENSEEIYFCHMGSFVYRLTSDCE